MPTYADTAAPAEATSLAAQPGPADFGSSAGAPEPGPIPWGKSDPLYLWTLAEGFLFGAWGREPTPEEVVPFWRGLTGGTQLAAPAAPVPIASEAPEAEPPQEPEAPDAAEFAEEAPDEPETAETPAAFEPAAVPDDAPVAFEPPQPPIYEPPTPPSYDTPETPAAYEPPQPPIYEPPAPPTYDTPETPAAYEPLQPPIYEPPAPPTYDTPETPAAYEPPAYHPPEPPIPSTDVPAPPAAPAEPTPYDPPLPPTYAPAAPTEPPPYDWPATQADPMEAALRQNPRIESLNLIEAAMRQLRAVTVGRLREKPQVLAVRVGAYGFEVLLKQAVVAPEGWTSASEGYVLTLPQAVSAADLNVHGHSPSLCPTLIPVGDTLEGPLLLNLEETGCLVVSGPPQASVNLLNAVVATLGSSPLAGDTRIIAVGLEPPAGLSGWENVYSTSFDSPELEELLSTAGAPGKSILDVLAVGPGNDLLIERAGQVASSPASRLSLIGATCSVAARWPWRIHVDDTGAAVVHPIACTMSAAQATPPQVIVPQVSRPLSTIPDASLTPANY